MQCIRFEFRTEVRRVNAVVLIVVVVVTAAVAAAVAVIVVIVSRDEFVLLSVSNAMLPSLSDFKNHMPIQYSPIL